MTDRLRPPSAPAVWPVMVTAGVYLAFALWYLSTAQWNFSWFVHLPVEHPITRHFGGAAAGLWVANGGYDGIAYYATARELFHPAAIAEIIDYPILRYRRIFYPLLVRLLSLGHEPLIAPMMLLVNLAATMVGVYLLQQLTAPHGLHPAWALLYSLHPGVLLSFLYDLPTAVAVFGVLWSVRWWQRGRWVAAGLSLCAAMLTWEVLALPVAVGWGWYAVLKMARGAKGWRACLGVPMLAAGLAVAWEIVLKFLFPADMSSRVVGNLGFPLLGWQRAFWHFAAAPQSIPVIFLLLLLGLTAAAAALAAWRYFKSADLLTTVGFAQALLLAHLTAQNLSWPMELTRKTLGLWLCTYLGFARRRDRASQIILVGTLALTALLPWLLPRAGS